MCGITSLQMGVFGGILVGLGVAALHNKYYKIQLPQVLSFFGGTRFVPIISALVYTGVGIVMFFVWPVIQSWYLCTSVDLVLEFRLCGNLGIWIYGASADPVWTCITYSISHSGRHDCRRNIWKSAVRLSKEHRIFSLLSLADPSATKFAVSATRFMSGKFPLMIFGLAGSSACYV